MKHRPHRSPCIACPAYLLGIVVVFWAAGCTPIRVNNPGPEHADKTISLAPPSKYTQRVSSFLFWSDFELKTDLPLFKDLATLPDSVARDLQIPVSTALVQVYLFEDKKHYEEFMGSRYPDLPKRRAFFVAQQRTVGSADDLLIYTYWGDRIQQDLRHEGTHALLHSVLKDVPLWLDEGLAEYYELPPDWKGVNLQHLELLRHGQFQPDLERLEQLTEVAQMTPAEYREAWAWVHMMLQGKPEAKAVLLAYLQQLRTTNKPGPLAPKLAPLYNSLDDALARHLAKLDAAHSPTPAAQK